MCAPALPPWQLAGAGGEPLVDGGGFGPLRHLLVGPPVPLTAAAILGRERRRKWAWPLVAALLAVTVAGMGVALVRWDSLAAPPASDLLPMPLLSVVENPPGEGGCTFPAPVSGSRVISYTYDGLGRLSEAAYRSMGLTASAGGECYQYTYDAVGNREVLSETTAFSDTVTTAYQYDAANRLTAVDGVTYTWDARGNLAQDGTFTHTHDSAGRMAAASVTNTLVYTYNADGLLTASGVNTTVTRYTWDWASPVPEMLSDGDALYLVGLDTLGYVDGTERTYYLSDALGSVRQLADGQGYVAQRYEYAPFGEPLAAEGTRTSLLRYTGEMWDGNTGLLYLRARWYASQSGRFTRPDPHPGSTRLPSCSHCYTYARNDPVNTTDPTGLFPWPWEWPAGLVVDLVKVAYCKVGPLRFCFSNPDDGQWPSDTLDDLFTDFVCEYGPEHRRFYANAHLTQQLARSHTVHSLRSRFYLQGSGTLEGAQKFEVPGFILATLDTISEGDETRFVIQLSQLNITHFMGGFQYRITELPGVGRIRFQIDNTTDLESGSRIPAILGGADPHSKRGTSVEALLRDNPDLWSEPIGSIIETYPIISILEARERNPYSILGGGTMEQTFTWCERSPLWHMCGVNFLLLPDALTKPSVLEMCP